MNVQDVAAQRRQRWTLEIEIARAKFLNHQRVNESFRNLTRLVRLLTLLCALLCASYSVAAAEICAELSRYFGSNPESTPKDPSRAPTKAETALIDKSRRDLLDWTDYATGFLIVDADNDGKEGLFVWNVQGTGRYVSGELYELPKPNGGQTSKLTLKASIDLGVLQDPRLVRFKGLNYQFFTANSDESDITISKIVRTGNVRYGEQTLCRMKTFLKPET